MSKETLAKSIRENVQDLQIEKTGSRYASECKQTGDGRKDI